MGVIDFMLIVVPAISLIGAVMLVAAKGFGETTWTWRRVVVAVSGLLCLGYASWSIAADIVQRM